MDRKRRFPADRTAGSHRIAVELDNQSAAGPSGAGSGQQSKATRNVRPDILPETFGDKDIRARLDSLRSSVEQLGPGLVAVSGGLDSRLLVHLLWTWNLPVQAVHMTGPQFSLHESGPAVARLSAYGAAFHLLEVDPMTHPGVRRNTRQRCYHCKRMLFQKACELAAEKQLAWVADGSHAGDLKEYRPGMVALKELGIRSPFARVGLDKPQLRRIARALGLPDPHQPSRACLLTRFPYDYVILPETLYALAGAEDEIARLGLGDFRLRVFESGRYALQLARSEAAKASARREAIARIMARYGFSAFDVAVCDRVSGYHDT